MPVTMGRMMVVILIGLLCVEPSLCRTANAKKMSKEAKKVEYGINSKAHRAVHGMIKKLVSKGIGADLGKKHTKKASALHAVTPNSHHRVLEEADVEGGEGGGEKAEASKDLVNAASDMTNDGGSDDDDEDDEVDKEKAKEEKKKMIYFLIFCFVTICVLGAIAYSIAKINNSGLSTASFFGLSGNAPISIFVGMSSGLVFGFIDNAGLFFGMEYLDPFFSTLPNGDEEKVGAGYGNTFSDMIGSFLGTFCGSIVKDLAVKYGGYNEADGYPIWTEAIGITLGCIIGVLVPRAILGDPKKARLTEAQADAIANGVTQDQINEVMSVFDKLDKEVDTERQGAVRVSSLKDATPGSIDKFISQADAEGDNDGWVTKEEILSLLTKANKKLKKAQKQLINKTDKTTDDQGKALTTTK